MRKRRMIFFVVCFVFLNCSLLMGGESGKKNFSQSISFLIGEGYWGASTKKQVTHFTLAWEGWIVRSRVVGFYFDGQGWPNDEDTSLGLMSFGVSVRPLGIQEFDPFLMIGFLAGKMKDVEEIFDMPLTVGMNWWLSSGFGIKAQIRLFPFSGQELFSASCGLFTKI